MADQPDIDETELARLADGSLPKSRQAELRATLSASSELQAALTEQERAVSMMRALDQPAPARLRAQIDGMTGAAEPRPASRRRRLWRPAFALPAATALAVIAAAIVVLAGGGTAAPTVPAATNLALASATLPPPAVNHAHPTELTFAVGAVAFPNWQSTGWHASGARSDHVGGRQIRTVYYRRNGTRVGYAIASGSALAGARGRTMTEYGVRFTLGRRGGARSVTWLRDGHTCVVAAHGMSYTALLNLIGSDAGEAVASQPALGVSHRHEQYL